MSKYIELAKKLNELAKRGVGGEKDNATAMLNALMKKHKISMTDIEGEAVCRHYFSVNTQNSQFFAQIVGNVNRDLKNYRISGRGKLNRMVECNVAEGVEIRAKFNFYWKAYEEDLNIFYSAFIQKNKLYRANDPDEELEPGKPMTIEEKVRAYKIANMTEGLDRHNYLKQLK